MLIFTKATATLAAVLIASGCDVAAADAAKENVPTLEVVTSKVDAFENVKKPSSTDIIMREEILNSGGPRMTDIATSSVNAAKSGYNYRLQINATTPLEFDHVTGEPVIDKCKWGVNPNEANFTWYGLRIQLSDEASTRGGSWYSDVTRYDLGLVQKFNITSPPWSLLEFNITTPETQPKIRMNWNDAPFYETFKFDFVDTSSDTSTSDGSSFQEFKKEMRGSVYCYGDPPGGSRRILYPVIPTLTISMQKFNAPSPSPVGPPQNAAYLAAASHGTILSIFSLAIIAGMATAFF